MAVAAASGLLVPPPQSARRGAGFNGSLMPLQRKSLAALQEAVHAFALDHPPHEGDEEERPPDHPGDPISPGSIHDEAAEAELLGHSRAGLLRFLRARDFDVIKARDLAIASCKWRASVRPWDLEPQLIPQALPSGALRFGGHTKAGLPILMFDCVAWEPSKYRYGLDEFVRYIAYFVEGALGRMGPGVEQFCMIWSVKGWNESHMGSFAVRCMAQLLHILQTMYPERTGAIFVCGASQLFQGYFFRILRPWMNSRFLSSFRFLSDASLLFQLIDAGQLPPSIGLTQVGGTHEEFPIPLCNVADELDAFIVELGGPDCLPTGAPFLLPQQTTLPGDASGTHVGEVDLLVGKPVSIELWIADGSISVDWHITGSLHGVVFGFKVLSIDDYGDETILEEGTSTQDPSTPTPSPAKLGAIEGTLGVKPAWAGCTLRLTLFSSYARQDYRTLQYCIGVQAKGTPSPDVSKAR